MKTKNILRPRLHYAGEISKRTNHRRQKCLSAPVNMRIAIIILAAILDLCLKKTRADKSLNYRDVIVFEKLSFSKYLPSTRELGSITTRCSGKERHKRAVEIEPTGKCKAPFTNSSVFKSVFQKLRFWWTIFSD